MHVHDTIYGISADSTDADDLARVAEGQEDWLPAGDVIILALVMFAAAVVVSIL